MITLIISLSRQQVISKSHSVAYQAIKNRSFQGRCDYFSPQKPQRHLPSSFHGRLPYRVEKQEGPLFLWTDGAMLTRHLFASALAIISIGAASQLLQPIELASPRIRSRPWVDGRVIPTRGTSECPQRNLQHWPRSYTHRHTNLFINSCNQKLNEF